MILEGGKPNGNNLGGLDLEIVFADNGASALLKAHAARPDIVVAAAELPLLDGFLMLQALRSERLCPADWHPGEPTGDLNLKY